MSQHPSRNPATSGPPPERSGTNSAYNMPEQSGQSYPQQGLAPEHSFYSTNHFTAMAENSQRPVIPTNEDLPFDSGTEAPSPYQGSDYGQRRLEQYPQYRPEQYQQYGSEQYPQYGSEQFPQHRPEQYQPQHSPEQYQPQHRPAQPPPRGGSLWPERPHLSQPDKSKNIEWTPANEAELLALIDDRRDWYEVARELNRTPGACTQRYYKLRATSPAAENIFYKPSGKRYDNAP